MALKNLIMILVYIFDSGDPKFVWVRQKFSGLYNESINRRSYLIEKPFSLSKCSSN